MKPNIKKTIWAEYWAPTDQAKIELTTCEKAENITLWHTDICAGIHVKNRSIILTASEFDAIAEILGYKRVKFDSMKEVFRDSEINLIND